MALFVVTKVKETSKETPEGTPKETLYELLDDERGPVKDVNRFLNALHVRGLSEHTIRAYAHDALWLYRWLEDSGQTLKQLKQPHLLDFVAAQRAADAQPSSINRRLSTARQLFCFCTGRALEHCAGTSLPAPHFTGPGKDRYLGLHKLPRASRLQLRVKVPRVVVEPLTVEQVKAFLHSLRRYRDVAIVQLMLLCGLRSREVLSMRLEDVGFADGGLRVRGKGDKERVLPIPGILSDSLNGYLRLERPSYCGVAQLFVVLQGKRRGQPMSAAGLRSLFRHRRISLPLLANANAHRMRHTFGADMARCGVRLPVLQKMMGHARPTTTLRYITLSMADISREFLRAMAQLQRRYEEA